MKKPLIVVVGSLNMDLVVSADRMPLPGETIEGHDIHYIPGGKGANQAVGCARLGGIETVMLGAVGNDSFGDVIMRQMENFGLETSMIAQLPDAPTGTATIIHTKRDNCIVIVPGANGRVTPEMIDAHAGTLRAATVVLTQLEIPLASAERAFEHAKAGGALTILNPAPAPAGPLPERLLELADILTPNETEFAALSGTPADADGELLEAAMQQWQEQTGCTLVVTRGAAGCSYLRGGRLHTVPPLQVEVADTTGAGDCLNAALSWGLTQGFNLEESVEFAVQASSLSVTKFGAQAGMPTAQEVRAAANRAKPED